MGCFAEARRFGGLSRYNKVMFLPMPRWRLFLLALAVSCVPATGQKAAPPKSAAKTAFDKPTLEAYIRHLFAWGNEVKLEIGDPKPSGVTGLSEIRVRASSGAASIEQLYLVPKDGKKIIQGVVYDIADNPFRSELSKLGAVTGPSLGTPGAPVVLVVFTDYQCPYCREEAKMLRENLIKTFPKEVRLYLKELPLEQIHPWAKAAAMAGRCVFQQGQEVFWQFHDWIFDQQAQITPENLRNKVMDFAQGKPIDTLQLGRCLDTRMMEAEVNMSVALAKTLGVNATPTLFINGRRMASQATWEQLRAIIANEIQYQKTAKNAGDTACCEVSLPSPLAK